MPEDNQKAHSGTTRGRPKTLWIKCLRKISRCKEFGHGEQLLEIGQKTNMMMYIIDPSLVRTHKTRKYDAEYVI